MSLRQEVEKFKSWASTYPIQERPGAWEDGYGGWATLHEAALVFLASSPLAGWTDADVSDLLYVIARNNESEYLAEHVAKNPDMLLRLAKLSLSSREVDAKWQLAAQLGALSSRMQEAEALLLEFAGDENEYVSRRALLSLGFLKSPKAEALAERAWNTGHEYQRIAALWVLECVAPEKLPDYLRKAKEDGRESVVRNARQVQKA